MNARHFVRNKERYIALFHEVKHEKRLGEVSVWYLYSKRAASEIKEFCPSGRIIIMLRNPVDMIYSLHSQRLYNGGEDLVNFEAALAAEEDRKRGLRLPNTSIGPVEGLFYRDTAKYSHQVQRYLDVFGRENIHIIIFEDFKSDTPRVYRETLHFLDVNEEFQLDDFQTINASKRVRSNAVRDFLGNPPQAVLWFSKGLMPRGLRKNLIRGLRRINTKYELRPPMSSELRQRLQKEFIADVEKLSQLLKRDLTSIWMQPR